MATPLASTYMEKKMEYTIPQEIIFEIFSWLPVKSLLRYRCVSKIYNSLVSESNFVELHHHHSMTRPGGRKYIVHQHEGFYTAELKEDEIRIEYFHKFSNHYPTNYRSMCVNGLFCAWRDVQRAVICNASTREVRFLPYMKEDVHPNGGLYFFSIGFEPEKKQHKICLTVNVSQGYTRNWVLTLGTDESWRERKCIDCFPALTKVCINGVIYILSHDRVASKLKIVAFDVQTETFRVLMGPHDSTGYNYRYELIEVKGKLVVLKYKDYLAKDIRLWTLGHNEDWESHIIRVPLQWKNFEKLKSLRFICSSCDNDEDIIFENNLRFGVHSFICYNIMRKSWREFKVDKFGKKCLSDNIFGYVESLFSGGNFF